MITAQRMGVDEPNGKNRRHKDAEIEKMRGRRETIFILKHPSLLKREGGDSDNHMRIYGGRLTMLETTFLKLVMEGQDIMLVTNGFFFFNFVKTILRRGPTQIFTFKSAVQSGG